MTTSTSTLQQLAREAYDCFETSHRDETDEDTTYVRVRDGSPEWVRDLTHHAHGDFLPDDWRYAAIEAALETIAESDDPDDARHEYADGAVDIYTTDRFRWLGSNLNRQGYCDEAGRELGFTIEDSGGIVGLIGLGQYFEADETYGLVLAFLENRAEEVSDNSDQ